MADLPTITWTAGVPDTGQTGTVMTVSQILGTGPKTLTDIVSSLSDGTQKAQVVDGSGNPVGLAQGSTTSGQVGSLSMSATTTAAPTYVDAKTNPLSTDTAGNLRVTNPAAAASIAKAEDAASANADVGVPAMAVRKLTPINTSGTDGDYEMLQVSSGQLHVNSGHFQPGTNGFLATPFALISNTDTGSDTLGSGSAMTSATGPNANGKISQTDTVSARKGYVYLIVGDAGWTPTSGGVISGWFLNSTDGGTTFETLRSTPSTTVPALPRPPDFQIPVYEGGTALSASDIKYADGLVNLPTGTFKTVIQNLTGAAFGNTTTTHHAIMLAPIA